MSTITSSVQQRDIKVFDQIKNFGQQSVRKIAVTLGFSASQVQRSKEALSKRDIRSESGFWESPEGYEFLRILVFAVMLEFGIKGNQGADRMTSFFKRIHIDKRVGVSASALRDKMKEMENYIIQYGGLHKEKASGSVREIIAGGDETFFRECMLMVLMDLGSGYIIVEEEAPNRSYETWNEKAQKELKASGLRVRHFISDRGKSLMKLALSGFNCAAGADIFHAQYDISKWMGTSFGRQLSKGITQLKKTEEALCSLNKKGTKSQQIKLKEQELKQDKAYLARIERGHNEYSETQQKISETLHAFSTKDNQPQTSEQVESYLKEQSQEFKRIANDHGISDNKESLKKYVKQIKDMVSAVDSWWLWVIESIAGYSLGKKKQDWLLYTFLPVVYWHQQMEKAQNPKMRKIYQKAWEKASFTFNNHSMTNQVSQDEINQWVNWADWISGKFQRASSAIEGRNGYLSQMHHNGRGITSNRLKALTAIHNYDTKRRDGTTAAERLYDTTFPDLFEWIIEQMGDLPLPRKSRGYHIPDPLRLQTTFA